jgi:hypothetical protein
MAKSSISLAIVIERWKMKDRERDATMAEHEFGPLEGGVCRIWNVSKNNLLALASGRMYLLKTISIASP